jgi:hypothetical protein
MSPTEERLVSVIMTLQSSSLARVLRCAWANFGLLIIGFIRGEALLSGKGFLKDF